MDGVACTLIFSQFHCYQHCLLNISYCLCLTPRCPLLLWRKSPPIAEVLFSLVSITCSRLGSKNIKWETPEINNSILLLLFYCHHYCFIISYCPCLARWILNLWTTGEAFVLLIWYLILWLFPMYIFSLWGMGSVILCLPLGVWCWVVVLSLCPEVSICRVTSIVACNWPLLLTCWMSELSW